MAVLQSGTKPSKNDKSCTATTTACCWLKPNAGGFRSQNANSTVGAVSASPSRPDNDYFGSGLRLLDGIANVVESAGLGASAVPLSAVARQLADAGQTQESMGKLRTVLLKSSDCCLRVRAVALGERRH